VVLRPPLPLPPAAALVWHRKEAEQQLFKALQFGDAAGYQTWLQLLGTQLAQYQDKVSGCWQLLLLLLPGIQPRLIQVAVADGLRDMRQVQGHMEKCERIFFFHVDFVSIHACLIT
jgi:hypothetical protein